ncbi:MAG: hypothetical protein WC003_15380, partial [Terrimicrobiaceae bacterium]
MIHVLSVVGIPPSFQNPKLTWNPIRPGQLNVKKEISRNLLPPPPPPREFQHWKLLNPPKTLTMKTQKR